MRSSQQTGQIAAPDFHLPQVPGLALPRLDEPAELPERPGDGRARWVGQAVGGTGETVGASLSGDSEGSALGRAELRREGAEEGAAEEHHEPSGHVCAPVEGAGVDPEGGEELSQDLHELFLEGCRGVGRGR